MLLALMFLKKQLPALNLGSAIIRAYTKKKYNIMGIKTNSVILFLAFLRPF